MKTKRLVLVLALAAFLVPSAALAAPPSDNYCFPTYVPDRCWSVMQWLQNWGQGFFLSAAIWLMKAVAILFWLFDRAAVFVFQKSLPDNGWIFDIRAQMLNLFSSMMPSLIRETAFGANGLMYVALSIAGLLLMMPMWAAGARFVRAEKVMLWGIVLSVFFVAGSFGYDFIGAVESFRQNLVSNVAHGSALPVDKLVLQPMLAGDGDLGFGSSLLTLPSVFDSSYFPAPQTTEVTISEGGALGLGNANVEMPEDLQARWNVAGLGVFYAFISALGGWLLLVSGFAYIVLSFAALILILFLFAALPLGFFEVGETIMYGILSRYFQIVVQSLGLAFFLRWLSSGLAFLVEVNTVTNALIWAIVLAVMILIANVFLNGAVRLLLDSGKTLSGAVTTASATFGGPSVVGTVAGALKEAGGNLRGIGNGILTSANQSEMLSSIAAPVSGIAMAMGRPDIAMAAQVVGAAAGSGSGSQAQIFGSQARGDVFINNGAPSIPASKSPTPPPPHASPLSPPAAAAGAQASAPDTLRATSAFYAAAARNQWDQAQINHALGVVREAVSAEVAVERLRDTPGFERVSGDDLSRAVKAAREMQGLPVKTQDNNHGG